jgi:acetyl-CoA C-acetyltransferase
LRNGLLFAAGKLLDQHGLRIDNIGLWELNKAFAIQALYCRGGLGIDVERYEPPAAQSRSVIPTSMSGRARSVTR